MPIDFAPPQTGNLQGFNVAPPPNPDPLATLAQMSQLRTQGLQQQQAQLGIQQAQMQLASQRGLMQAFVEGGGDFDKTIAAMRNHPDILPTDYLGMQQHAMQIATQRMALTKDQQAVQDHDNERWSSLLNPPGGITSQDDLNKAFWNGIGEGLKVPPELLTPQGQPMPYTGDPTHYQAIANSLLLPSQISAQKLQAMEAEKAQAETAKTQQETQVLKGKVAMYNAMLNPQTGGPDPSALKRYVDSMINPQIYPDQNQRAFVAAQHAWDMDSLNKAIDDQAKTISESELSFGREKNLIPYRTQGNINEQAGLAELVAPGLGAALQATGAPEAAAPSTPAAGGAPAGPGMTALPGEPIIRPGPVQPTPAAPGVSGAPAGTAPTPTPAVPGARPISQLHGEDWLRATNMPQLTANQIRALNDGRQTLDEVVPARNQIGRARYSAAMQQFDPTWTPDRAKLRSAFTTTGPDAANIRNNNVAVNHAQQFLEAAEAMKNGTFTPMNAAFNAMRQIFGSKLPTNLEGIKAAWAGEMATALKGTATDDEIKIFNKPLDNANSFEQFEGIVEKNLEVLGKKLNGYHEQAQAIGVGDWSPITPSAQAILRQHGIDPTAPVQGGGTQGKGAQQGGGKVTSVPPLPARLAPNDVGKVYRSPRTGKLLKITAVKDATHFQSQEVNQ